MKKNFHSCGVITRIFFICSPKNLKNKIKFYFSQNFSALASWTARVRGRIFFWTSSGHNIGGELFRLGEKNSPRANRNNFFFIFVFAPSEKIKNKIFTPSEKNFYIGCMHTLKIFLAARKKIFFSFFSKEKNICTNLANRWTFRDLHSRELIFFREKNFSCPRKKSNFDFSYDVGFLKQWVLAKIFFSRKKNFLKTRVFKNHDF